MKHIQNSINLISSWSLIEISIPSKDENKRWQNFQYHSNFSWNNKLVFDTQQIWNDIASFRGYVSIKCTWHFGNMEEIQW